MAHMDRISMGDMYGVHNTRLKARARAPDLVAEFRVRGGQEMKKRCQTGLLG